jgi:hypothetical protein
MELQIWDSNGSLAAYGIEAGSCPEMDVNFVWSWSGSVRRDARRETGTDE